MEIIREPGRKPVLRLLVSDVKYVSWKYRGYLSDPRILIHYIDGGVFMSGRMEADAPIGYMTQLHPEDILNEEYIPEALIDIFSVDWKFGKNVNDKRLVIYRDPGGVYTSGPFPLSVNVPLLAQTFLLETGQNGRRAE
jgi:hypothetical protein